MDANIVISKASLEREIYIDESSGYAVFIFSTDDEIMPQAVKSTKMTCVKKYPFFAVCKGSCICSRKGVYKLEGKWEKNQRYGYQFQIDNMDLVIENTKESIIAYLLTFDTIGPKLANRIYAKFGADTLQILDDNIDLLKKVRGLSDKRIKSIKESLIKNKEFKEITNFFAKFTLPLKKVRKIYEAFHSDTLSVVTENPFKLCAVQGIDFYDANEIAIITGVGLTSNLRVRYAIYFVYKIATSRGHLFLKKESLLKKTEAVLNKNVTEKILYSQIEAIYHSMIVDGSLIEEKLTETCVYLKKNYLCEKYTANRLVDFLYNPTKLCVPAEKLKQDIVEAQKNFGIILNNTQIKAIETSINNNISIITGGPGTGKTTILKIILYIFQKNFGARINLCAPTGRAARRMAESTGFSSASTIHNLLGIGEDYEWAPDNENILPIDADLLVVDEVSMVDMELMHVLLNVTPFSCKVIFIGDADQLPSVGAGNVLREMVRSKVIPTTVLDKIYRQDGFSKIIINSHKIKNGNLSFEYDSNFNLYETDDISCAESTIISLYLQELRKEGANLDNVQILTPFKSTKMPASTVVFNTTIQEAVNPKIDSKSEIRIGKTIFRTGDKVIQQKNTSEIKNGDIGYITKILPDESADPVITIDFGENRVMEYTRSDMEENMINLAYAITIHKSQGSEYKSIIMPMVSEHQSFLWKNLIYTAWTRAKETVLMVGAESALLCGAKRCDVDKRNTLLAARMKGRNNRYRQKQTQKSKQYKIKDFA